MVCFWFIWNCRNDAVHNSMAKQELCRAVNIKLYNTQANNIKNNQQLNKQWSGLLNFVAPRRCCAGKTVASCLIISRGVQDWIKGAGGHV
jgi:hypothetical protein